MAQRTPQQEYAAALAAYTAAQERLTEARRHYDPKSAPEAIAQRRERQAEYRAKRLAERNTPEAKAERERWRQEQERWRQQMENTAQRYIEIRENQPQALRILTRVGDRQ
jgi:hypothetical protein